MPTPLQLMRFPSAVKRDPAIEAWMHGHAGELGAIARRWFELMRACGDDVRELLHDGHVKLRPDREVDAAALTQLIETAYADMRRRLKA